MTKKEYIVEVIDCFPEWEMGKTIKSKVINGELEENTINKLVILLNDVMKKITAQIKENKLLEKIEKEEEKQKLIEDVIKQLVSNDVFTSNFGNEIESRLSCAKKYQVFVSSTFSDLIKEREKVSKTILALGCIVAGMELFPASNKEQFEYIKHIIDESDYYVLILGGRYGSLSEDGISYTEKEFDYAKEKGIPILAFLHKNIEKIPFDKSEIDEEKRAKLLSFRKKVQTGRLVQFWENAEELSLNVSTSLSQAFNTHPSKGWVRS